MHMKKNIKIVVIGGSGLIGTKVVKNLRQRDMRWWRLLPPQALTLSLVRGWPPRLTALR